MSGPDPRVVRGGRVDAQTVGGGWSPDIDSRMDAIDRPVRRLLEPALDELRGAEEVVVVPDAHFPFHPSSGVVTDPAVVGSLLAQLRRETDATLSVAGSSDDRAAFDRTAAYLGYPAALERSGASLLDLSTTEDVRAEVSLPAGSESGDEVALAVPEPLVEAAVVVVPTLRPTREGTVAGAMRTLGRHAADGDSGTDPSIAAYAVSQTADPALALLDATVVYAGESYAADALLSGPPAILDAVGTDLLDRSIDDDAALSLALESGTTSIRVDGLDPEAMKAELPSGELPPTDDVHPAVSAAYGLYARVAGDAVPPQLEADR